ncbi:MAG: SusD/RagB family nutrient-binding outer membrane lipoprotein, partial [Cyclobacteriaceae bacterium]
MNRIRKYGSGLLMMVLMLFTVSSCDLTELDINKDPNNPAQASLSLLLTNVQLNASDVYADGLNNAAMGFMALNDSFDGFNMTNSSFNNTWNYLYNNPLKDLDGILKATAAQRADGAANPHYEGIAKVLKAYYFSLMVDLWGNVPYTEAFNGDADVQNLAPAFEDGASIYPKLITLLDEAVVNLAETSPVSVTGDVMYGGSATKWTGAAKSLK